MSFVFKVVLSFSMLFVSFVCNSQDLKKQYDTALKKLNYILQHDNDFKEAVFIAENTYFKDSLSRNNFNLQIEVAVSIIQNWVSQNSLKDYRLKDSLNVLYNFGIYHYLKDTIKANTRLGIGTISMPYSYDFNDFFGVEKWSNMFVTKLLNTRKGNCHSLPYLYKILADELGASCWLSLAPNHIYIKNRCKKIGWYNTELTSGEFPIDAWITTSGYIPVKAVQTGMYMDTLSNQQAIALCVLDLAKCYEFQTRNYYDGFIIKCCDLVLQYHPVNVQAMLLKAETLKRIYEKGKLEKSPNLTSTFNEMEELYAKLFDLGYREMPEKMYLQWLRSVTEQRNKYGNKQLKETLKSKTK